MSKAGQGNWQREARQREPKELRKAELTQCGFQAEQERYGGRSQARECCRQRETKISKSLNKKKGNNNKKAQTQLTV